ncbi:phage/plasmid primase, P4 family [Acidiphilium multivorum]|uniref:phage/plasmid primase, P4 family n=1 Tax=Acidiphilium multivorum TaxID=62140 RepID=UPI0039C9F900
MSKILEGTSLAAAKRAQRQAEASSAPLTIDPTEDAVAQEFAATIAGAAVYDHTASDWFLWRDGRWARDDKAYLLHLAREFCRSVRNSMPNAPGSLGKIAFSAAVEKACRADPRLAVSHDVWDRDRWLLGVPGGAIDLRTGKARPASPDLYIGRQCSVAPAPGGTPAPLWRRFLADATNHDEELQTFLQRLAGYLLTGDVTEEVVMFCYGSGGNGKGVFLGALTAIMGEYAVGVPIEAFTAGSRLNLEYYRATMAGARLVTASETEAQASWAESQIKEMSGNETPLSARQPYGQPFTFSPQFKIVLVGNHAPKLKGRSQAMERRLRVIPFDNQPPTPDPDLKEKLRSEYPGILRWMIDGCLAWQRERLGNAAAIQGATSAYFEQQDAFRRWLDERCDLDPTFGATPGALLADFNSWARTNGEDPLQNNAFAEMLDRLPAIRRVRVKGARICRGIAIRPQNALGGDGGDRW